MAEVPFFLDGPKPWPKVAEYLSGEYGPGMLCRDQGGNLFWFVYRGGPPHWMPQHQPILLGQKPRLVRIFFLRGSDWRPSPANGWEVLWREEEKKDGR